MRVRTEDGHLQLRCSICNKLIFKVFKNGIEGYCVRSKDPLFLPWNIIEYLHNTVEESDEIEEAVYDSLV